MFRKSKEPKKAYLVKNYEEVQLMTNKDCLELYNEFEDAFPGRVCMTEDILVGKKQAKWYFIELRFAKNNGYQIIGEM